MAQKKHEKKDGKSESSGAETPKDQEDVGQRDATKRHSRQVRLVTSISLCYRKEKQFERCSSMNGKGDMGVGKIWFTSDTH